MDLKENKKNGYVIHKVTDNNYCLCKILNEYNTKEECNKDLIKLLTNNKKEKDILKDYSKKDILK